MKDRLSILVLLICLFRVSFVVLTSWDSLLWRMVSVVESGPILAAIKIPNTMYGCVAEGPFFRD